MLEPGFSLPWPDAIKELTGSPEMNAQSLIDYFKPLSDWLEQANKMSGECIGWDCAAVDINNTVPIIVGCVLAGLVVVVIIAYFIGRSRNQKKHKQISGHDNPTAVTLE